MKTVRLYGNLAKRFGKEFKIDVKTPIEAVRALSVIIPGFKQYMAKNKDMYTLFTGYDDRVITQYHLPFSEKTLRIVPVVAGSGSVGRIILGVALIFVAPYLGAYASGLGLGAAGPLTSTGMFLMNAATNLGFAMILGGISQLLFSPPSQDSYEYAATENKPSFVFSGAINTTAQGNPVPVGYGQLRIGSQVISAGLEAQQVT